MSFLYDQFGKRLMSFRLARFGHADTEYEVVGAVQKVDIWYRPDSDLLAANVDERAQLGPLAALLDAPCMIEPFHHAPSPAEVLSCFRKQHNLAHALALDAGTAPADTLPDLWILSAGYPRNAIARYGFRRMSPANGYPQGAWPKGFWYMPGTVSDARSPPGADTAGAAGADAAGTAGADAEPGYQSVYMVVINELPRTRATLPLRLMGGKRLVNDGLQRRHGRSTMTGRSHDVQQPL